MDPAQQTLAQNACNLWHAAAKLMTTPTQCPVWRHKASVRVEHSETRTWRHRNNSRGILQRSAGYKQTWIAHGRDLRKYWCLGNSLPSSGILRLTQVNSFVMVRGRWLRCQLHTVRRIHSQYCTQRVLSENKFNYRCKMILSYIFA